MQPTGGHGSVSAESPEELAKKLAEISAKLPKFHKEAKDRVDVAISKLIAFSPVFGTVFMFLNKKQERAIPTMGVGVTDRVNLALYYNPEFVMSLTHKELRAVLTHEAMHVLLHHISRREHYDYQPMAFNIAADMAINCHLSNLPDKAFYPKTFNLEDFQASEWYYENLKEQAEKNGHTGRDGIPMFTNGKGDMVGDHSHWGECEDEIIKEKIRNIASEAIKEQNKKGWSEFGEGLAKAIIDANKPQINWKREFRWFINKLVLAGRRSSRTRLNRREHNTRNRRKARNPDDPLASVYLQPGSKKNYTSKLLVAIDTSGSMSDKEIEICLTEVNGMVDHVECHVTFFDTAIQGEPVHISKRVRNMEIRGRGGTNFAPVLRYVDEHQYDGVIIMTDGFAPFPEKPKARILWAVTMQGQGVTFPYGKRVLLDIKPR
jgi:predicted metal-dependent peptidase